MALWQGRKCTRPGTRETRCRVPSLPLIAYWFEAPGALSTAWGFDAQDEMGQVYESALKKCRVCYPEPCGEWYLASGNGNGPAAFPFVLSKAHWQDSWRRGQRRMKLQILVLARLQLTAVLWGPRGPLLLQSVGIRSSPGHGGSLGFSILSWLGAELWEAGLYELQVDREVRAEWRGSKATVLAYAQKHAHPPLCRSHWWEPGGETMPSGLTVHSCWSGHCQLVCWCVFARVHS